MLTYNQKQMVYWINERENIRLKKKFGEPAPWSDNKVMQKTYFCNVDREDDKVTKWIRENWRYNNGPKYYTVAMAAARLFNLPSTLELIGQPTDIFMDQWLSNSSFRLSHLQEQGQKIWNGAYIVSTQGKKVGKLPHCFNILREISLSKEILASHSTLQSLHSELIKIKGIGLFIGAQIIADIKNSDHHPLQIAPDWWTFSAPGPGSLRGLEWFFEEKVTAKNYHAKMDEALDLMTPSDETGIDEEIMWYMCMQNLQNCFCEYDKFMRVTNGTGRSKRHYNGKG